MRTPAEAHVMIPQRFGRVAYHSRSWAGSATN